MLLSKAQVNDEANFMRRIKTNLQHLFILLLFFSVPVLSEQEAAEGALQDPYQKIEQVTSELLMIIEKHKVSFEENENAYFEDIDQLLNRHVDFPYIAKKVMGNYGKKASLEQKSEFAETFRNGLVETYGRGLIGYTNEKIVLLPRSEIKNGQRVVAVKQEIHTSDAVYPLEYTVAKKKTGEWKVINMIINGINLGKTFRNQFLNSAKKAGGDIDQVIDGWSSKPS